MKKNICPKCKKPRVTFIQGGSSNTRATGVFMPCDCPKPKKIKIKMVYDNLVRDSKYKKNGYVKYRT